ncbi:hypothetical protein GCM10007874_44360 [Labrys miyagiensis]|uniref:Uncharacterized protein n=1 Tax=Labrys miyagiensis TaxID=346912 RepID=A0ABQ6CRS7_9HYPH|nr:hypothetical protein [Labrys miyagiensis]GLS21419.1 hypothetical protein GCM10007874_44360 [Labrys miyagiensis]
MIPASYFFKNVQCRQWEQPELPEGVPAEAVRSEEQGWLRSLVAAFRARLVGDAKKDRKSQPQCISPLRG